MSERWPAWQLGYMSGLSGDEQAQAPYPRTPDTVERIRWWQDGHFVGLHDYRKAQGKQKVQGIACSQCGRLFLHGAAIAAHIRFHHPPEAVEEPVKPAEPVQIPEPEEDSVAAWKKQEVDRGRQR